MTELTLEMLAPILRAAWSRDTCDPHDLPVWTPANPSRGQCGVTALVVQELLGGELLLGEVLVGGVKVGHHWWNRLPVGRDVDLTAGQFRPEEIVTGAVPYPAPTAGPRRITAQWQLFRGRVMAALADQERSGTLISERGR
ncbi:hypothetical protein Acy02nite_04480 [Actinoplanes cyaneus]|uniref:Uncharacterized protein n=1 Tax=Actinoplanes cyaneus TaxID=52696 RepID=A0A919IDT6_9ACTN|nr:hypothetical protein [Actinoplanes cyaneus]MCW2136065.1 hypothetical protein [Actinoplanes cyaneus]GID62567.1 hypothetical protein Acy02nite_04480 [Actinoplanes cyaneus]